MGGGAESSNRQANQSMVSNMNPYLAEMNSAKYKNSKKKAESLDVNIIFAKPDLVRKNE
jgi:hypothetical protein